MVPRKGREEYKKLYIVEERKTAEEKLEKIEERREGRGINVFKVFKHCKRFFLPFPKVKKKKREMKKMGVQQKN